MLNKARKKFILWAMIAMIVIVLVLVAAVNIFNWYQNDRRLDAALIEISEFRTGGPPPDEERPLLGNKPENEDFKGPKNRQSALTQYGSRFFTAVIDSERQVINIDQKQEIVTLEDAQEIVDSLPEDYSAGGYVNAYKYRCINTFEDKTAVCFLDCSTDLKNRNSLLLISVIVGAGGIILAFLFILRMSRIAVEPVRVSIEKQKQFITNAGHELKTPLTSISTNMDILTMDLGKNEWVESTRKQVGKLRKLVENLVSLSKMEEDESLLAMQEFSVSDLAHECAEGFDGIARMDGKRFSADIAEGLSIHGDPGTIGQLLSILCDNAVKYSAGSEEIRVRLYDDGKNVCFETVNDWDHNVDEDHLEDLFERFYRGDPSRSSENKKNGHGLGLSIAKAIAAKNNAKLTAETNSEGQIVFRAKFRK